MESVSYIARSEEPQSLSLPLLYVGLLLLCREETSSSFEQGWGGVNYYAANKDLKITYTKNSITVFFVTAESITPLFDNSIAFINKIRQYSSAFGVF